MSCVVCVVNEKILIVSFDERSIGFWGGMDVGQRDRGEETVYFFWGEGYYIERKKEWMFLKAL